MSNAVIIYASTHHGNTKKVVDAIAKELRDKTAWLRFVTFSVA